MPIHLTPESNPVVQEGTLYVDSATGEFNVAGRTVPHIIPGVLYPAYEADSTGAGKLMDGTTEHGTGTYGGSAVSTDYGTTQSDGRKYYFTNIAGSKPIKDPRIGGHFGSQRHRFSSAQLLEQETATQGDNVYSIDGREWIRAVGDVTGSYNNSHGNRPLLNNTSSYFEIVGYFSSINISSYGYDNAKFRYSLDGASEVGTDYGPIGSATPLGSRYVKAGSLVNIPISTTLGIHTIKLRNNHGTATSSNEISDIELIAQDTSNRNNIQIPSQDVVSYGKKFTVSAEGSSGHHYDPFSAKTDGSAWTSPTSGTNNANSSASWPTNIDTATSLGLDKWVDGSNYYRPYNGGRVVKWVDSSGTIKTSVTVMPPNAKSIKSADVNKKAKNAPNDTYLPTFEDETTNVNEDLLHEVAKTFHFREFGNGSANGNASYKDVSTLDNNTTDVAYVMDDGTTSYSGESYAASDGTGMWPAVTGSSDDFLTFIGTGITIQNDKYNPQTITIAQNLPYGTHILKSNYASSTSATWTIDGVAITATGALATYNTKTNITFHQPKKPPIPEDACVLADFMLMAAYVPQTSNGIEKISKGVRLSDCSRDVFFDSTHSSTNSGFAHRIGYTGPGGFGFSSYNGTANATHTFKQEFYGDGIVFRYWETSETYRQETFKLYIDDTLLTASNFSGVTVTSPYFTYNSSNGTFTQASSYVSGQYYVSIKGLTLGHHTLKYSHDSTADTDQGKLSGFDIATPIHTSSHYQTFESPFLHELIGGDRNMEQTNLVCSPDGKSWDEVTRDTSYLASNIVVSATTDTTTNWSASIILDEWRGQPLVSGTATQKECFNKDSWAIAYDMLICLKDGTYEMQLTGDFNHHQDIYINGTMAQLGPDASHSGITLIKQLNRGDTVQPKGYFGLTNVRYSHFYIKKIN